MAFWPSKRMFKGPYLAYIFKDDKLYQLILGINLIRPDL